MGRKFRDIETTGQWKRRKKNGDVYVYESTYKYDPQTRKNRRISSRLVGKIRPGTDEIVPTREKQPKAPERTCADCPLEADRLRMSLTDILEWAGKESGIDADLGKSMDERSAQRAASLARYVTATDRDSLSHMETWQLNHPVPSKELVTEDVRDELFKELGLDETARQCFFRARTDRLGTHPLIAYDSTSISTYSKQLNEARYGYNKDGDNLPAIKYLTLYAVNERQPIAFGKIPNDIPDVIALINMLKQMKAVGLKSARLVLDNGFWSESNVAEMAYEHVDFVILCEPTIKWVHDIVDAHLDDIRRASNRDRSGVYVATEQVKHTFARIRKHGSTRKSLKAGDKEEFSRRMYVHVCFDPIRKDQAETALFDRVLSVKQALENGTPVADLTTRAVADVSTYLTTTQRKDGTVTSVVWNDDAMAEASTYQGYFVLVTLKEKDGFKALRDYRKRETVEEFYHIDKEYADGRRPRVWSSDTLMGRMMVQFVGLCYEEFLRERIRLVKEYLQHALQPSHLGSRTVEENNLDRKTLRWLNSKSFHQILDWFDAYESVRVTEEMRSIRWNAETTRRDRRFLQLLMLPFDDLSVTKQK